MSNTIELNELKIGKIFYINNFDENEVIKVVFTGEIQDGWKLIFRYTDVKDKGESTVGVSRGFVYRTHKEAELTLKRHIEELVDIEKSRLTSIKKLAAFAKLNLNNDDEIVNRVILESAIELGVNIKEAISKL